MAAKLHSVSSDQDSDEDVAGVRPRTRRAVPAPAKPGPHDAEPPASPALNLQNALGQRLTGLDAMAGGVAPYADAARWSTRRTLGFILVSNALAWAVILWAGLALLA